MLDASDFRPALLLTAHDFGARHLLQDILHGAGTSREADSRSVTREIPRRVRNSTVRMTRQFVIIFEPDEASLFNADFKMMFHLRPGLPIDVLPSSFSTQFCIFYFPLSATCPAHLIIGDLVTVR
jgi:hypothetical protein